MIFKYKSINYLIDNKLNYLIYLILFNYNLYIDQHIRNLMGHKDEKKIIFSGNKSLNNSRSV